MTGEVKSRSRTVKNEPASLDADEVLAGIKPNGVSIESSSHDGKSVNKVT